MPPQYAKSPFIMGDGASVAISTTPLRILGATSWTGATTNGDKDRIIEVCNPSATYPLYLRRVPTTTGDLSTYVTSSDFLYKLGTEETREIFVPAGYDLVGVRTASAAVRVQELLYR